MSILPKSYWKVRKSEKMMLDINCNIYNVSNRSNTGKIYIFKFKYHWDFNIALSFIIEKRNIPLLIFRYLLGL